MKCKFEQVQFYYVTAFGFGTSDRSTYIRYKYDTESPLMVFNRDTPNSSEFKFHLNFHEL